MSELEELQAVVDAVIRRYENPREPHNVKGGVPRGQLAWAMYTDLKDHAKWQDDPARHVQPGAGGDVRARIADAIVSADAVGRLGLSIEEGLPIADAVIEALELAGVDLTKI